MLIDHKDKSHSSQLNTLQENVYVAKVLQGSNCTL